LAGSGEDAPEPWAYRVPMPHRNAPLGGLIELAALASINSRGRKQERCRMITSERGKSLAGNAADHLFKSATRQMWALGDYHRFATETVWQIGPVLVKACGIGPGQRVLDVACGTGNTAIRAAEAGAQVVASDLTPEHFDAGRRAAAAHGVELDWIEADAESLPFPDESFDAVTSSFGAIFAPDHAAVARELTRVCRPGGVVGMTTFRPEGLAAEFFELLGRYLPPAPPHALPPLLWGDEAHVRALFSDRVASLEFHRARYVERSAGPETYRKLFETAFGPVIAVRNILATDRERLAAFDREFRDFTTRGNRGTAGDQAEYPYDYLLLVARR
jgi:ubiquinone/menaquinone biosynthesis C-methylase UbiE